jgi:hypothetical protein
MKKTLLILLSFAAVSLTQAQFSIQKVVIEEFTGAWCGYCPEGAEIMESILDANQRAIGISVHSGDAMEIPSGDALATFYGPNYPQALINRQGAPISRGSWASAASNVTQGSGSVTVAIDNKVFNTTTRVLTFDINTTFTGNVSGDLRFHAVLTEDSVVGTGSGYNQVNYFNTTSGHTFQGLGNPIVGYVHDHVMRDQIDGTWGTAGIIPATVNFGQQFSKSYTYTIPANQDYEKMHLVAYISNFEGNAMNQRKILNGEEVPVYTAPVVGIEEINAQSDVMQVAPNPISSTSKVLFTLREAGQIRMEVMNPMGQRIAILGEGFMNEGAHTLYWNGTNDQNQPVANGAYFIRLVTENGQSNSTRILVQR